MLQCIKATLLASLNGYAPAVAVEFGRKVLYSTERPSFAELEDHVKQRAKVRSERPGRERLATWHAMAADEAPAHHRQAHQEGRPRRIMAAPGRSPTPTS